MTTSRATYSTSAAATLRGEVDRTRSRCTSPSGPRSPIWPPPSKCGAERAGRAASTFRVSCGGIEVCRERPCSPERPPRRCSGPGGAISDHDIGILPRGSAVHVPEGSAIDLLAKKRSGLSLLAVAQAEADFAKELGRPVGIVLTSEVRGEEAARLTAAARPL